MSGSSLKQLHSTSLHTKYPVLAVKSMGSHQGMKEPWMHPLPPKRGILDTEETMRRGIQDWDQPGAPTTGDAVEGKEKQIKKREMKGTEIPNWENFRGFSLSYTFVPAIGFSIDILLVFYSSHLNLATSPSSPHSWSCPGLKVFTRSSRHSPVWDQWEPWPISGGTWRRLQSHISKASWFPKALSLMQNHPLLQLF